MPFAAHGLFIYLPGCVRVYKFSSTSYWLMYACLVVVTVMVGLTSSSLQCHNCYCNCCYGDCPSACFSCSHSLLHSHWNGCLLGCALTLFLETETEVCPIIFFDVILYIVKLLIDVCFQGLLVVTVMVGLTSYSLQCLTSDRPPESNITKLYHTGT